MDNIQEEYFNNRKKLYLTMGLMAFIVTLMVFLKYFNFIGIVSVLGLIIAAFGLALWGNVTYWKCPSCNNHLGKLYAGLHHPKYCPECGIKLTDDD